MSNYQTGVFEKSLNNDYLKVFDLESEVVVSLLKSYKFYCLIIGRGYSEFNNTSSLKYCVDRVTELLLRADIVDLSGIYQLKSVKSIRFDGTSFPKESTFDFTQFSLLKDVHLEGWKWYKGQMLGLLQCTELDCLRISYFNLDVTRLSQLKNLRTLFLGQSNFSSLDGISHLVSLEKLILYSILKLTDISDLVNLKSLKKINFESIGATDISVLGCIKTLEEIILCKKYNFENFNLFSKLQNLKFLSLNGQIECHNFEVIFALKNMKKLTLIKQKSFKLTSDELVQWAAQHSRIVEVTLIGKKSPTIILDFKDNIGE